MKQLLLTLFLLISPSSPRADMLQAIVFGNSTGTTCSWGVVGSNITLSNSNNTWTSTSSSQTSGLGAYGLIAGTGATNSTYLRYFEVTVNSIASDNSSVGISNQLQNVNVDILGNGSGAAIGMGLGPNGATHYLNSSVGTLFTYTTGAIIGDAVDFPHQKQWWTKNGTTWNNDIIANQNPATNTGGQAFSGGGNTPFGTSNTGPYYTIYPAFGNNNSGDSMTFNGTGSFSYTLPSGFSAWCSP
jgi:hypothetical protein